MSVYVVVVTNNEKTIIVDTVFTRRDANEYTKEMSKRGYSVEVIKE